MQYEFDDDPVDSDEIDAEEITDESSYVCDSCGEEIIVPIDFSEGSQQEYVEDCPVCCNPNEIVVEYEEGEVRVWSRKT